MKGSELLENPTENKAEFDSYLEAATAEIKASSYYAKLTSIGMVDDVDGKKVHDPSSLYGALLNWWRTNFDPSYNP